jgi:hypothetical protein
VVDRPDTADLLAINGLRTGGFQGLELAGEMLILGADPRIVGTTAVIASRQVFEERHSGMVRQTQAPNLEIPASMADEGVESAGRQLTAARLPLAR